MKVTNVETLCCDAGWRPWMFIKISTDEGIVGYSECTDSNGSPHGLFGCVKDLSSLILGKDPRAVEKLYWDMYRATRQSTGSVLHKAIAGIENALLDVKAKALGIPVYELFGGPTRDKMQLYWSHCGTTRARSWEKIGKNPLITYQDVYDLGKEVLASGYTALKTNIIIPGDPPNVLMQGFRGEYGSDQNLNNQTLNNLEKLIGTFRDAVGDQIDICLDLNFNFKTDGNIQIGKTLEPYHLMWLELDSYNPEALLQVKNAIVPAVCSGEDLYTNREYRPYFEKHSMSIAAIDVIWNGLAQSKKIADMAEIYEINIAPHNHSSHLATLISLHLCAVVPNVKILEIDVDDVPWKEDLVTNPLDIRDGYLYLPDKPGWGVDIREDILNAHPWPNLN
jgi:galactonate dehydratase